MFDRVVCINLARRPERWQRFQAGLPTDWPFRPATRFEAIDGQRVPPPEWYGCSPEVPDWRNRRRGPWGCLRSHLAIWEQALNTDCEEVLILEDDALFATDFVPQVALFLDSLPANWHQLYLGGQHLYPEQSPPEQVKEWVLRPRNVNRTHAYAIRRPMMHALYRHLTGPWEATCWRDWHLDYQLGKRHLGGEWNVYAPVRWLVGQMAGRSDVEPRRRAHRATWWHGFPVKDTRVAALC